MFISWRKLENLTIVLVLGAISTIFQAIIVIMSYFTLPISSYFVLILVPVGVIPCLTASMIIFSDFLYKHLYIKWQNKKIHKRKRDKPISIHIVTLIASGIIIICYILLYLLLVFIFHDPILLHGIPTFGQFTLSESLSGLIILIPPTILKELQIAKKII